MSSPQAFKYTPSATARLFTYEGVSCAIDVVQLTPTQIEFGVLEVFSDGTAQWMGTDANTPGSPAWTIETQESPIGPATIPNPAHDPSMPVQGVALDFINAMGTKLLTDFIPTMNAALAARFPAQPPAPPPTSPPFTNETAAIAWLVAQVDVVIPAPINGQMP